MFVVFFACLRVGPEEIHNLSVMVGAVSNARNPLESLRVPGIHICDDDDSDRLMEVKYSYLERKLVVPVGENGGIYKHCRVSLSRRNAKDMRDMATEDSFLRFYVGTRTVRSQFAQKDNGIVKYATHFTIVVDNSQKPKTNPMVMINPSEFVEIKENMPIEFTFSVKLDSLPEPAPTENPLPLALVLAGAGLFTLSLCLSLYLICTSRNEANPVVPLAEIWRIQNRFRDSLLLSSAGIMFIAIGICLSRFCMGKREVGPLLQHSLAMIIIVPVQLTCLLAKTIGVETDDTNYVSISLLFYVFIMLPQNAFTVFFGWFGSFRGFRIRWIAINDPLFLLIMMILCRGWGSSGYLLETFFKVETTGGKSNFPLKGKPFYARICNVLYIVAVTASLVPACMHALDIYFNDTEIDWMLLWGTVVTYGGGAAFYGMIRTLFRTSRLTDNWADGHMLYHFFVAVGSFVVIAVETIRRYPPGSTGIISSLQVWLAGLSIAWAMLGISLGIGCFFSYVWSFVTMLFALSQRKSS